jgi:hypothetical protein
MFVQHRKTWRPALSAAVAIALAMTASACGFSPPIGEGQVRCGLGPDPCPPGFVCHTDGLCYSGSPTADAIGGGVDAGVDTSMTDQPVVPTDSPMGTDTPQPPPDQPVGVDMSMPDTPTPPPDNPPPDVAPDMPPADMPPPGCTSNAQCMSGAAPKCDTSSGQCLGCRNSGDCRSDLPTCDPGTHQCVQCTQDSQCPSATPHCVGRLCVECTDQTQCPGGEDCSGGICLSNCTTDAQCTAPATCNAIDPGKCGCVPKNCMQLALDCGQANNGCGQLITCNDCGL